jgi:hypothetical protein
MAVYRAAPVTQRDGSPLASSNCRMASIATGLDFETFGSKTSTGAKMRSYTDDQTGGTDSGDARQSWQRGYSQDLRVRDGGTFDDVLADLRSGRLVHLDIWAQAAGGPCLSGSGAYGHTVAVAPEYSDGKWLVADPWCSPPKWVWWPEAKLRAGAEAWGAEVLNESITRGAAPLAELVRRLMSRWFPGHERPLSSPGAPSETGGGTIYFTTTAAHAEASDMAISTSGLILTSDHAVTLPAGTHIYATPTGGADEIGTASGQVDYFGSPAQGWKAVRVNPDGTGSRIAYTTTAATAWQKDPSDPVAARDAEWIAALTDTWPAQP